MTTYEMMRRCWDADPNVRPTFSTLSAWFGEMLHESERLYYMEKNKPFEEKNAEYFRNQTDYLKMTASNTDNEYLRPLGKPRAYREKEYIPKTPKYMNSECFQTEMDDLESRGATIQDNLQEAEEPLMQK
ncbi:unnamed protein product [Darwinula stevensoni]|uniref:Serine-threonine/tyrosine-protein kinase catalytic domain-containing protein n=1 Tax=Darwinula stevensoni TaxID=69355 RepID=A0A7R8X7Z4_9CRUS|nr:unnamed protein product [Darwinula stevensoni]CAG0882849.1 unnamed protein product [Darwinula stevensoni]